jgi:predicted RNA-binding Zn-ribbon protein involved in translation (DUF1610 family)
MATIDQKQRYRQHAALCYELAKSMAGEKAASMVRLGDTYSALADNPDKTRPGIFAPAEKYADPECKKCGKKMKLTHALPRTEIMPAMQAFRCDTCGETLIWKSEIGSSGRRRVGTHLSDQTETHYVAISFTQEEGGGFAPGQAVECRDAYVAILRAELMARDKTNAGSVAFSRRETSGLGEFEAAVILKVFGNVPTDFDID